MIQRITDLPALRTRSVASMRRSAAEAADVDPKASKYMSADARLWETSELFWVTSEMAQVALDAADDLPPWSVQQLIPAEMGILVYAGGLPALPFLLDERRERTDAFGLHVFPRIGVDFLAWWRRGNGLSIQYGCFNTRLLTEAPRTYEDFVDLPMVPMGTFSMPNASGLYDLREKSYEEEDVDDDPMFDTKINLITTLAATWALMGQETVASKHPQSVYASKADQRAKRKPTLVTTISLRRLRHVEETERAGERHFSHRWIVRGHWRQQACGPDLTQRRPVWVPSYIKGNPAHPLLVREHVTVWRR